MNVTTPQRLAEAEQSAQALSDALPDIFKTPPAGVAQAQFDAQRRQFERQVITTQVWVATQRKDFAKVEKIYTDLLKANPNDCSASLELGRTILATKDKNRQVEALYHMGRAAYGDANCGLDAAARTGAKTFFDKNVAAFTGSRDDVQKVADQTKSGPFPPAGFEIKSAQQKLIEQEEAMKAADPQKFLWLQVKKALIADDGSGAAYFENIKGAGLPKLKGKLISALPANKPKELMIAIMDDTTPELKLVVDKPYGGMPPAGTVLEFEMAVPDTFVASPFLMTATIDQEQITGWPADMMGAPGKKTTVKKATPKKK